MHRAGRVIDEKKGGGGREGGRGREAIGFNPIHEPCLRPQRMRNDPLPHHRIYIEIELLIFAGNRPIATTPPCVDFTVLTITDSTTPLSLSLSPFSSFFSLPSPLFFFVFFSRDPGVTVSVAIYLSSVLRETREHE